MDKGNNLNKYKRQLINESEEITANFPEIIRIIREPYKQLCANKLDNLEELDKFLET